MNKSLKILFLSLLIIGFPVLAYADGNTAGYAWGENIGWINFSCETCNVTVSSTTVTGNAWSDNYGWINFGPVTNGGVTNSSGTLSGSAWGENVGWVNFGNTTINTSTGVFSGTATGNSITGSISFGGTNPVTTSYYSSGLIPIQSPTPTPTPTPAPSGGGGGGGSIIYPTPTPTPVTLPNNGGGQSLVPPLISFGKDLKTGDISGDVKYLQIFLNSNGFTVSLIGNGASGKESSFFLAKTFSALTKFQSQYAQQIGTGYTSGVLDLKTRTFINSLIGGNQTTDNSALIAQLKAAIQLILQQLSAIQAGQGTTSATPTPTPTPAWCYTFTKNLGWADSGTDAIAQLHTALQTQGIPYYPDTGNTYNIGTSNALKQFQTKYNIAPQSGYVGVKTRAKLNQLYGCK